MILPLGQRLEATEKVTLLIAEPQEPQETADRVRNKMFA